MKLRNLLIVISNSNKLFICNDQKLDIIVRNYVFIRFNVSIA